MLLSSYSSVSMTAVAPQERPNESADSLQRLLSEERALREKAEQEVARLREELKRRQSASTVEGDSSSDIEGEIGADGEASEYVDAEEGPLEAEAEHDAEIAAATDFAARRGGAMDRLSALRLQELRSADLRTPSPAVAAHTPPPPPAPVKRPLANPRRAATAAAGPARRFLRFRSGNGAASASPAASGGRASPALGRSAFSPAARLARATPSPLTLGPPALRSSAPSPRPPAMKRHAPSGPLGEPQPQPAASTDGRGSAAAAGAAAGASGEESGGEDFMSLENLDLGSGSRSPQKAPNPNPALPAAVATQTRDRGHAARAAHALHGHCDREPHAGRALWSSPAPSGSPLVETVDVTLAAVCERLRGTLQRLSGGGGGAGGAGGGGAGAPSPGLEFQGGARADPQQLQLPALLAAIEGAAGRRAEEAGRLRGTEAELRRQLREMVEAVAAARAAGPPAALAPSCSS